MTVDLDPGCFAADADHRVTERSPFDPLLEEERRARCRALVAQGAYPGGPLPSDRTWIRALIEQIAGARKSSIFWFSVVMPGHRLSGTGRPAKSFTATYGRLASRIRSSQGVASITAR